MVRLAGYVLVCSGVLSGLCICFFLGCESSGFCAKGVRLATYLCTCLLFDGWLMRVGAFWCIERLVHLFFWGCDSSGFRAKVSEWPRTCLCDGWLMRVGVFWCIERQTVSCLDVLSCIEWLLRLFRVLRLL